ncbi:hypothetical protein GRI44_08125 [Altererythrobacter confluentis]|uniref:Uncharacterized protein n=1 Tax=Allopontixanthobacter confluentis TaxID=1849021 RepID=A0A6L7GGW9_9SPHN|nr:hypothetical protein [Allopontixanthobacter confluentis]MXP14716.1 hypothetical protein [Allopontixanthobacter confluentis]
MSEQIIIAAVALAGIALVALVALRGWQGWLALKERELERVPAAAASARYEIDSGTHMGSAVANPGLANPGFGSARIEIADLKERIRKLEAIASGVDL